MIISAILLQNSWWNLTSLPQCCKRKPLICLQINAVVQKAILMQHIQREGFKNTSISLYEIMELTKRQIKTEINKALYYSSFLLLILLVKPRNSIFSLRKCLTDL